MAAPASITDVLVDAHRRAIRYLGIPVTDRFDLRRRRRMLERAAFQPRSEPLALKGIAVIAKRFIARNLARKRLTGGEPLVRRDVGEVITRLGRHVCLGLDEPTLTTHGVRLDEHAHALVATGVRRVDASLDKVAPDTFRGGDLDRLVRGIFAACDAQCTGGPARYWLVEGGPTLLGLRSPFTIAFSDGCERSRLTRNGKRYLCLGHDEQVDLKPALREGGAARLGAVVTGALARKPARHRSSLRELADARRMSAAGG